MSATIAVETESVLRNWRIRILNGFLPVVAAVSLPAYAAMFLNAVPNPATGRLSRHDQSHHPDRGIHKAR